jgi:hypothetical protein
MGFPFDLKTSRMGKPTFTAQARLNVTVLRRITLTPSAWMRVNPAW